MRGSDKMRQDNDRGDKMRRGDEDIKQGETTK